MPSFSGGFYTKALGVVHSLAILFPTRIKVIPHDFGDRTSFRTWMIDDGFRTSLQDTRAHTHSSSPCVWISKTDAEEPSASDVESFIGGNDDTLTWCRKFMAPAEESNLASVSMVEDGHKADHGYDYDLIVIGGGSGGMATAKEAAQLGAKVACLDFVKPSPAGTTWGLGGTCVNVGCIPKKLFHAGALLRESIQADSAAFGIDTGNNKDGDAQLKNPTTEQHWGIIRESIHNHIGSLNFKYRVSLREKEVTYLNKLAKFTDKHTIEATDKKGKATTITASRFLIATGGRPSALDCEGGDLSISSDDVFALENSPGKTLCVGASYISLECAGFLAGIGLDVTIAVRSILLRGFDRECADKIGDYMVEHGVKFKREVTPSKLEKTESGQIKVTFSDGTNDVYDTVLAAIGRSADTEKLGLASAGVGTNPKNGKVVAKYEQSTCPNIYAVGDVLDVSGCVVFFHLSLFCVRSLTCFIGFFRNFRDHPS
jgi:pyruvate/2-oxoglutarate dehydrogenase complex dihydrolipoamide dehydrogenase (E3) component